MIRALGLASLCVALLVATPARSEDPARMGQEAAQAMIRAAEALHRARTGAQNRLAAYATAVQAYERALTAARAGLRGIAEREVALTAAAQTKSEELARVLSALQILERDRIAGLLHPGGTLAAARAGHLLTAITAHFDAELVALQRLRSEIDALRAEAEAVRDTLRQGLAGLNGARALLAQALSTRTRPTDALPKALARLKADAASLDALAKRLAPLSAPAESPERSDDIARPLTIPLTARRPAAAERLALPLGHRHGFYLLGRPGALVVAPARATLRYSGRLRDHGGVAILELRAGLLLVLAGLGRIDRVEGEILQRGEPLGSLGGLPAGDEELLMVEIGPAQALPDQPLYIELRRDGEPVPAAPWFALDR
ncbi:MAG: hypothetical protein AAGC92_12165 [Pseudomonadota bacterium]